MMLAFEIEACLTDDDDATIRANIGTMQQMRISIDALKSQLRVELRKLVMSYRCKPNTTTFEWDHLGY